MSGTRLSSGLDGRTALVTGSGRNIGRAIALSLAAQGADIVVNGHSDRSAVDRVVSEIEALGARVLGIMADVGSDEQVRQMVQTATSHFGAVDIVVSNVGIRRKQAFLEITPDQWEEVLRTNLSAAFYLARHAIPGMRTRRWGRVVLVSGSQYTHPQREQLERETPVGRYGKPDEVAAACDLVCSERGAFISGQVIHVNGGHYMY